MLSAAMVTYSATFTNHSLAAKSSGHRMARGADTTADVVWTGDRKSHTAQLISSLVPPHGSVLDVGGNDFEKLSNDNQLQYVSIDLQGSSFVDAKGSKLKYDGRNLPSEVMNRRFDVAVLGFVLHHAADNTIHILRQLSRICNTLLIGEDLTGLGYPASWLRRNFEHDNHAVFRSDTEWRELFALCGFKFRKRYVIKRDIGWMWSQSQQPDDNHVYRCMYELESINNAIH